VPFKSSRSVRCTSCDITLNSQQQARQHYNGKAHQRRLQKLQQQQQQQQQQKELRPPPETEVETTATESREKELKQDAGASSGGDDVARVAEHFGVDAGSMTTLQTGKETFTYYTPQTFDLYHLCQRYSFIHSTTRVAHTTIHLCAHTHTV